MTFPFCSHVCHTHTVHVLICVFVVLYAVAGILRRMGRLLMNQGKFAEAKEALNSALAIAQLKYGPDHPHTGKMYLSYPSPKILTLNY